MLRARDWLRARGIAYVFTIAPDKHVDLPGSDAADARARRRRVARPTSCSRALQDTGLARRRAAGAVRRPRHASGSITSTDTHWNDRGALVAYQQIIGAVRARVPATPPAWTRDDFEPVDRAVDGLRPGGDDGTEARAAREPIWRWCRGGRGARGSSSRPAPRPTAKRDGWSPRSTIRSLPRAVIFRDSFVSPLVPFLSEHFSRAVYLWQNDFDANVVSRNSPTW